MPLDRRTFTAMSFSAVELIIKKREHGALSTAEIKWLVENYTSGVVADEQMSAMAMATGIKTDNSIQTCRASHTCTSVR